MTVLIFGEESAAVAYLDARIRTEGEGMEVLADESQLLVALEHMHEQGIQARRA